MVVLIAVVALLLVLPLALFLRERASSPLGGQLDSLGLPAAVDLKHEDQQGESQYCVHSCAWFKRIYQSGSNADQTDAAFRTALTGAGWHTADGKCPKPADGSYSCWQRDQYVLDLWVRPASCDSSAANPMPLPSDTPPDPDALPSAAPSQTGPPTAQCPAAQASVMLANAADPQWRAQHA